MMAYELLDNGIGKILILDKGKNLYMKIDIVEVIKISYPDSYKDEMYDIISIKGDLCDFKTFLLNAPKIEEIGLERQRDYPKDIEF